MLKGREMKMVMTANPNELRMMTDELLSHVVPVVLA